MNQVAHKDHIVGMFQLNCLDISLHVAYNIGGTLTAGDFTLLETFVTRPNRVLSRDKLIELLKGYERSPYDRSIDVRVTRLRKKIEPEPGTPKLIKTVRGVGYTFAAEVTASE